MKVHKGFYDTFRYFLLAKITFKMKNMHTKIGILLHLMMKT